MKTILLALLVIASTSINSQSSGNYHVNSAVILPQGLGIELLNSRGTSGIFNDVSNISAMNPASNTNLKNLSFGLSYQFQTKIEDAWAASIGTSRIYNYLPQSFGGIIHYKNLSFGLGAGQKYNGSLDFGSIPFTTSEFPDGTGETFEPKTEEMINYYSLSASYNFGNLLSENSNLSLGLKFNLNTFYYSEEIYKTIAEVTLNGNNFELGTLYKHRFGTVQNFQIGLTYKSFLEMEDRVEYTSSFRNTPDPGGNYSIVPANYGIKLELPAEIIFDFSIQTSSNLIITSIVKNVYWNDIASNVSDQIEFGSSAVYSFNKSISGALGFYYTDKNYKEDFFNMNDRMNAFFLITGISFNINFLNLDLAIADSHIFSGEYRKQTIGKFSLGVEL